MFTSTTAPAKATSSTDSGIGIQSRQVDFVTFSRMEVLDRAAPAGGDGRLCCGFVLKISAPKPPSKLSAPMPLIKMSLPAPPFSVSLPRPLFKVLLAALP